MILHINHLDPEQIAHSGQCFRWRKLKIDEYNPLDNISEASPSPYDIPDNITQDSNGHCKYDTYVIPPLNCGNLSLSPLYIRKCDGGVELSCNEADWLSHWCEYFDIVPSTCYSAQASTCNDSSYRSPGSNSLDVYDVVHTLITTSDDEYLKRAYFNGEGIRILRQDIWETIVSFMISQNNNITRISGSIEKICDLAGLPYNMFPNPSQMHADWFDDPSLGLGYRNVYIKEILEYVNANPTWLTDLTHMSYKEAYDSLTSQKGIGPKVANCICLFGLHHIEAFPIDTHMKQILSTYYPQGFPLERYNNVAGIVQQYMFNYKLHKKSIETI